jgi:capsular polysaccharide biosynthesis protein
MYDSTACRDFKADLVYSSQADVMIGVHGEGLFHAFFMPQHSSLIEIRPLNFTGHHPNQYMKVRLRCDHHTVAV